MQHKVENVFVKICLAGSALALTAGILSAFAAAQGAELGDPSKARVVVDQAELRAIAKAVLGLEAQSVSGRKIIYPKGELYELAVRTAPLEVRQPEFKGDPLICERHVIRFDAVRGKRGFVPSQTVHAVEYALPKNGCAENLAWIDFTSVPGWIGPQVLVQVLGTVRTWLADLDAADFCEKHVAEEAGNCAGVKTLLKDMRSRPLQAVSFDAEEIKKRDIPVWQALFEGEGLSTYSVKFLGTKQGPEILEARHGEIYR